MHREQHNEHGRIAQLWRRIGYGRDEVHGWFVGHGWWNDQWRSGEHWGKQNNWRHDEPRRRK